MLVSALARAPAEGLQLRVRIDPLFRRRVERCGGDDPLIFWRCRQRAFRVNGGRLRRAVLVEQSRDTAVGDPGAIRPPGELTVSRKGAFERGGRVTPRGL